MSEGITVRHANVSNSFAAKWTVPLAPLLAIVLMSLIRPMALAVTLTGLITDALGAITLAFGILSGTAANVRMWRNQSKPAIRRLPWWSRWCVTLPCAVASRFGAPTVSTSATDIEDFTDAFWGIALLVFGSVIQFLGAALQSPPALSIEVWGVWHSLRSRVSTAATSTSVNDPATTVLYALSTLAQTCAALAAFVGAVGVYRLQLLRDRQRDLYSDIRATQGAPSALTRQQVLDQAAASGSRLAHELRQELDALVPTLQSERCALIVFEGWNLLVIGASVAGFNYIPQLVHCAWAFWALWVTAVGTVAVTFYCVCAWTREEGNR